MKTGADIGIIGFVQSNPIARFTMLKCILRDKVECIAICQLRSTQCLELFWRGIQFELCRYHRFHASYCSIVSIECQESQDV